MPRTAKHKKFNLKRSSSKKTINLDPKVQMSDIMDPIHGCRTNLNSLPDFNPKLVLRDIMFAPVEVNEDENLCFKHADHEDDAISSMDSLLNLCGNGRAKGIQKCKSKLCKLRDSFLPMNRIVSSSTQRVYDVIVPPGTTYVNCNSSNLIYLLTCSKCSLQYVGETIQGLNQRFSEHRQGINISSDKSGCKILSEHFNSGLCKDSDYTVTILEKLEGFGRTERGAIDLNIRRSRLQREKHWMLKMRTVYPFGLNDRVGDEYKRDDDENPISSKFPKLSRHFDKATKGNHLNKNDTSVDQFLIQLNSHLTINVREAMNFLRVCCYSYSKRVLKIIFTRIEDILNKDTNPFRQWYLAVHDIIVFKLYYVEPKKLKRRPKQVITIPFLNKGIEMINLPEILHSSALSSTFPYEAKETYVVPTVVYKLNDTIHSQLFNYTSFVKNLDLDTFLKDPTTLPCQCSNSDFKDSFHGHVICGDLSIVEHKKLRELFQKGPQYREPVTINFDTPKNDIMSAIKELIIKWSKKYKIHKTLFDDWLMTFSDLLNKRINRLIKTIDIKPYFPLLKKHVIKNQLKDLHSKYVITPIDKASNNVAFICKRYYAQVLVDELGFGNPNNPEPTYIKISNHNKDKIVKKHLKDIKRLFGIVVEEKGMDILPNMHWTPKKHKVPSKSRFIVAAKYCSLKKLAQTVTEILKMFYKQIENYNRKSHFFSYIKSFWVIQNKDPLVKTLKKFNDRNNAKTVSTYDFSTLYTKIPHLKLKEVLHELTDFCFKGCTNSKILIHKNGARWSHDPKPKKEGQIQLNKKQVKDAISYLLDNCYFSVGKSIFKQVVGIPMGSDPAPFMANLFLYHYESKFLKQYKTVNMTKARKFNNVFRFIDDLCAVNDDGEFEKNIKNIYPEELELKKENAGLDHASFLDLNINISNRKFSLKLYDKRDDFNFDIVRMPFLSNNMPSRIFYSSYSSELLRIARCTTERDDFLVSCDSLVDRMWSQGAKLNKARVSIRRVFSKHKSAFVPFFETPKSFSDTILSGRY